MRAAQYDKYGPPEVLHEGTAEKPVAGEGDVLVKVHGSSVNVVELRVRAGALRIATGFGFPKGIGLDFAGEVEAVGDGVAEFAAGDRVWGFLPGLPHGRSAAAAEYLVTRASHLSKAPKGDLVELAALPLVGETALLALREHGHLKAGDRLLVRGASGGVGTVAVQLGKAMGAHVTALVGAKNLQFIRDLGADAALDYRTHDANQLGTFDLILDLNGSRLSTYRRRLTRHGRMVTTSASAIPYILFSTIFGPKRVRAFSAAPRAQLLADLAGYVESGSLKPIVDSVHPLAKIADAHRSLEKGDGRGKRVVRVLP
ncbi:MAG: NAD(P)-dependent alcohol dehydrogenase [Rhodoglobus sp.]